MNKLKRFITTLFCFFVPWLNAEVTPRMMTLEKDNQTIYLLGSVHAGKPNFYPLPDYVMTHFDRADAIAFEIDMTDAASMALGMASKQMRSMFTDDKRLSDYLSDADIAQIEQLTGKPVNLKLKPAEYVLDLLTVLIEETPLSVHDGVDIRLLQDAIVKDKRIIGLETLAEQISIFFDLPVETQAEMLSFTLHDWDNQKDMLLKLVELWRTGDEALFDFTIQEMKRQAVDEDFIERLLYQRNQHMADELIKKQSQGIDSIFCTIGAMHIYGDRSVTDYLQKAGYKITETYP